MSTTRKIVSGFNEPDGRPVIITDDGALWQTGSRNGTTVWVKVDFPFHDDPPAHRPIGVLALAQKVVAELEKPRINEDGESTTLHLMSEDRDIIVHTLTAALGSEK